MTSEAPKLLEAAREDLTRGYSVRAGTRLRQAADTGDPEALLAFASCLLDHRIPGTALEARARLENASNLTPTLVRLRSCLRYAGVGGAANPAGSLSDLIDSALRGDSLSAVEMALLWSELKGEHTAPEAQAWLACAQAGEVVNEPHLTTFLRSWTDGDDATAKTTAPAIEQWPTIRHPSGNLLSLSDEPEIFKVTGALSRIECAWLCETARVHLAGSRVFDPFTGTTRTDPVRTSDAMNFSPANSSPVIYRMIERVFHLANRRAGNSEPLAILRYLPGQEYKPHYDWLGNAALLRDPLRQAGQRVSTILIYLKKPAAGGRTLFPRLDLEIAPEEGDLLYFSNVDANGQPARNSLHAGEPVHEGEKWIGSLWLRENEVGN